MFEKFGEFDSAEELNKVAKGFRDEVDKESLFALAKENGIDKEDAEDYWDGATDELASETMAAVGRIATEREETKADSPARVILLMISGMMDDVQLRKAVMKKGKRAGKLLEKMRKTAEKHKTGGTGVCCGTDKQLKDLIRAYYLQTDEELDEKLEALYK